MSDTQEILELIHGIAIAQERIDGRLAELSARVSSLESTSESLKRAVLGNDSPGLRTKVAVVEEKLDGFDATDITVLKSNVIFHRRVFWWVAGILGTILGAALITIKDKFLGEK